MVLRPLALGELKFRELYDAIHRGLLQRNRLPKLDTSLGQNALIPLRARGTARIGRDYNWTIDVASLRDDTALLSLMHQPVTLWIQQPTAPFADSVYRPVHGFVHRVGYLGGDGGLSTYQIEFSSALVFLGGTRDDEGWFEQTAQEIVSDLLNRYPQLQGRFRFSLNREPAVRSWCRQSETDLRRQQPALRCCSGAYQEGADRAGAERRDESPSRLPARRCQAERRDQPAQWLGRQDGSDRGRPDPYRGASRPRR